jgi:hypothetical protein
MLTLLLLTPMGGLCTLCMFSLTYLLHIVCCVFKRGGGTYTSLFGILGVNALCICIGHYIMVCMPMLCLHSLSLCIYVSVPPLHHIYSPLYISSCCAPGVNSETRYYHD